MTASSVAIDHRHLLAWTQGSDLVVRDDRSGERRTFDLGPRCDSSYIRDGRDGRFLIACDGLSLIVHARYGPVWSAETGLSVSYNRIGTRWLEGTDSSSAHLVVVYENWRTGASHTDGRVYGEDEPPYDLDGPELRRIGPEVGPPFAVDGRWVLFTHAKTVTLHRRLFDKQLGHCAVFCEDVSIGSGLALWRNRGRLHGYVLATGARRHWRVPEDAVVLGANERRIYYARRVGTLLVTARSFAWR